MTDSIERILKFQGKMVEHLRYDDSFDCLADAVKIDSWIMDNNGLPYFYQCKECALIVKSHLKEEHKCYGSPKKEWFFKTKSFIQKMKRYCKYKLKLLKEK